MQNLAGKKLLVIGGAFQHCKVIEAAKKLGVVTYVTDYLPVEKSPGKQIADHYWMHNITDYDEIVADCRKEQIDGVISICLDACQRPYQQICEKLGVPCFGTKEQFHILTDKTAFKQCCVEHGVDVIPAYTVEDFADAQTCARNVEFPIFVKPCDSRGSRGQSVCNSYEEAKGAIAFASSESSNGEVVIEKYMGDKQDFSMTYVVLDGEAYLTRTGSRFLGAKEDRLDRLAIAGVSPSSFTEMYMAHVHERVVGMLKDIGLKNAPVFMQGFIDGDTVRFYDPGLRFPGIEYERMYERACGLNPIDALIEFALTGMTSHEFKAMANSAMLNGKVAVDLLVAIRPGMIKAIRGLDEVQNHPDTVSVFTKYGEGDTVGEHWNVNQRFCEIDIVCEDVAKAKQRIAWIYNTLVVEDENGENMVFSKLNPELL